MPQGQWCDPCSLTKTNSSVRGATGLPPLLLLAISLKTKKYKNQENEEENRAQSKKKKWGEWVVVDKREFKKLSFLTKALCQPSKFVAQTLFWWRWCCSNPPFGSFSLCYPQPRPLGNQLMLVHSPTNQSWFFFLLTWNLFKSIDQEPSGLMEKGRDVEESTNTSLLQK